MVELRHTNPLGHVDLPLIGRQGEPDDYPDEGEGCLKPGEVFEVTEAQAEVLLEQAGNYELADRAAEKRRQAFVVKAREDLAHELDRPAHDHEVYPRARQMAKRAATKKAAAKKTAGQKPAETGEQA